MKISHSNPRQLLEELFTRYQSRNERNLKKVIAEKGLPPNTIDQLVAAGLIGQMTGNLAQVHYERISIVKQQMTG